MRKSSVVAYCISQTIFHLDYFSLNTVDVLKSFTVLLPCLPLYQDLSLGVAAKMLSCLFLTCSWMSGCQLRPKLAKTAADSLSLSLSPSFSARWLTRSSYHQCRRESWVLSLNLSSVYVLTFKLCLKLADSLWNFSKGMSAVQCSQRCDWSSYRYTPNELETV